MRNDAIDAMTLGYANGKEAGYLIAADELADVLRDPTSTDDETYWREAVPMSELLALLDRLRGAADA